MSISKFNTGAQVPFLSLISSIPTEAVNPRAQPHFKTRGDRLFICKLNAIGRPPAGAAFCVTQFQNLIEKMLLHRQNDSCDLFAVFYAVY